jgi:hypothetical protein
MTYGTIRLTDNELHHVEQGLYRQRGNFIYDVPDITSALDKVTAERKRRERVAARDAENDAAVRAARLLSRSALLEAADAGRGLEPDDA